MHSNASSATYMFPLEEEKKKHPITTLLFIHTAYMAVITWAAHTIA